MPDEHTPTTGAVDPTPIIQLSTGFWASMVLIAANDLNVFTALDAGPATADDLAPLCGAQPRSLGMLLDAGTALGFVRKSGDRYANAPIAAAYLVKGKPGYVGTTIKFGAM